MSGETFLSCAVVVEWMSPQGSIMRKVNHKVASLRIIRNEFREMFMEISNDKSAAIRLQLRGINVFKKFMAEGKASIKFQELNCTVFLSNAPPTNLVSFLRTIFVKMTGDKEVDTAPLNSKSLRTQLLSGKAKSFEEISPITIADIHKAKSKVSKSTTTTPSPPAKKRKMSESSNAPVAKKLYSPSPLSTAATLNPEQAKVLEACLCGKSIFFTGSAGTGKSFLLRKIIAALPPDVTIATASTGVAACHIGGTTLHVFAGIGRGEAPLEKCYEMASKPMVAKNWRRCKHLIIDEISMVEGKYFEKIEAVARYVRKNDKPFGGIQLILCGDFLQLPPVVKSKEKNPKKFCFQSDAWDICIAQSHELRIVHRQKDEQFISMLNNIRIGRVTKEITDKLLATSKQKIETDGILATRLCSHTNDSNLINESKLNNLEGEERVYKSQDSDNSSSYDLDNLVIAPSKLVLKVGAQVMLLKNINVNAGLVNGARGVVVKFEEGLPVVRFKNCKEYLAKTERWIAKSSSGNLLCRKQVPLNLAWAFSIHKSQGLTLDCVEMSLAKTFEAGQAYVALSRAQSLDTLRVLDFDPRQVWANPDVLEFYQKMRKRLQRMELIPLGSSKISKGKKTPSLRELIMNGKSKMSRIPLS